MGMTTRENIRTSEKRSRSSIPYEGPLSLGLGLRVSGFWCWSLGLGFSFPQAQCSEFALPMQATKSNSKEMDLTHRVSAVSGCKGHGG